MNNAIYCGFVFHDCAVTSLHTTRFNGCLYFLMTCSSSTSNQNLKFLIHCDRDPHWEALLNYIFCRNI